MGSRVDGGGVQMVAAASLSLCFVFHHWAGLAKSAATPPPQIHVHLSAVRTAGCFSHRRLTSCFVSTLPQRVRTERVCGWSGSDKQPQTGSEDVPEEIKGRVPI